AAHHGHENVVRLLLLKGADPYPNRFCCPLYHAANVGWFRIVQMLIKHGAKINGLETSPKTPLMAAVSGGHVDVVRLLLDNGADINTDPAVGREAYSLAASRGYTNVMRVLVE
ncbi:ankyrin, partial [Lepidopterella palustris CBS 459.81]